MTDDIVSEFRRNLEKLLNRYSKEAGSNTPDFILAGFLIGCLDTYDNAVKQREDWYGRPALKEPIHNDPIAYFYGKPPTKENNCPECGGLSIRSCHCLALDSECALGHKWHICKKHLVTVRGHSDHASQDDCSCGKAAEGTR